MNKVRCLSFGLVINLLVSLGGVSNIIFFTSSVYGETLNITAEGVFEDDTKDLVADDAEELEVEEEEVFEDRIFIKAYNPGYAKDEIGEFLEIGGKYKGDSFLLADFSIKYMDSSGNLTDIYVFSETLEMVGESLLLRLQSSPEVKEVGVENYEKVSDLIYSKNMSKTSGRIFITKKVDESNDEIVDSLCWGLKDEDVREGETCYVTFKDSTTLVRNEDAEEMDDLFIHTENYLPSFDSEKPNIIKKIKIDKDEDEVIIPKCREIVFSEILTYFETTNLEQFIEIFNQGDEIIDLEGCMFKYKNKRYGLFGEIHSGELKTFYPVVDFKFSLTKNPTSSNMIEILDTDDKVVDRIVYYSGQRKGVSLAQFGYNSSGEEQWLQTYSPTPGEENNYQQYKTCQVGKVINPETGNCVSETTLDKTLEACPEGKYRNPLTNRCKSYAMVASAELKPCADGYERNPATGRCKKIVDNSGALYPIETENFEEKSKFVALYAVIGVLAIGMGYILFQFKDELKIKLFRKK